MGRDACERRVGMYVWGVGRLRDDVWSKFWRFSFCMGTVGVVKLFAAWRGWRGCLDVPVWFALYISSLVSCALSASRKSFTAGQFTGPVAGSAGGHAVPVANAAASALRCLRI